MKALIVDDAIFMRNMLRGILQENGYETIAEAASGIEAMRKLHDLSPDIIILDIILPDINGLNLLEWILSTRPQSQVVVCSAICQETVIKKAMDLGAKGFLQKPFTPEKVIEVLSNRGG